MVEGKTSVAQGAPAIKGLDPTAEADKINAETVAPQSAETPKRRGRPKGSRNRSKSSAVQPSEQAMQMAFMVNGIFASALGMIGGPEAIPEKKELDTLNAATAAYFATKPDFAVPPGMILLGAYAQVTIARFSQPKPKEKLKALGKAAGLKVRAWWGSMKFRYFTKGKEHDPTSDEAGTGARNSRSGSGGRVMAQEATTH